MTAHANDADAAQANGTHWEAGDGIYGATSSFEESDQGGLYGVIAEFDTPEALIAAARATRDAGYTKIDGFSPLPLEELPAALGMKPSVLPVMIFFGGLTGTIGGFLMQYIAGVIHYPLNVGGRSLNGWPMFIPIAYELTILLAAFTAVFGMLLMNGLPSHYHPAFNVPGFERATNDRFFLLIEAADPKFDREAIQRFLTGLQPLQVHDVPK
jgi:hypothetical protein